MFHVPGLHLKQAEAAIVISDMINFKLQQIGKHKDSHYILVKGKSQQQEITLIDIYTLNILILTNIVEIKR